MARRDRREGALRVLTGKPLKDYVARLQKAVAGCGAPPEVCRLACERLDFVASKIGRWEFSNDETPSLPNLPRFHAAPGVGKSYSNIPVPRQHRRLFNGRRQRTQSWKGQGLAAWCDYAAHVEKVVGHYRSPPEAAVRPAPLITSLDALDQYKGRTDAEIDNVVTALFNAEFITGRLRPSIKKTLMQQWGMTLGYLVKVGRTRIDQIDQKTLLGYRAACEGWVRNGTRSLKTANDYLKTLRRILKWCIQFCDLPIPNAYELLLANFTKTETVSLAKSQGGRRVGKAETIAMPVETLRAWLKVAARDPFDLALTMCSINLAAGAVDLSELTLVDTSSANPQPCTDMDRKLFITQRIKTLTDRWTMVTETGDKAIPMMKRTYEAIKAWLARREVLIAELGERRAVTERIARAAKARQLKATGATHEEIAAALEVPVSYVGEILQQPDSKREWARALAKKGYSLRDVVEFTGLSKATVSGYIRDITATQDRKPRSNRHMIVTPDLNRVFFVPTTGRPLVNRETNHDYVSSVFNRICEAAGIVREVDVLAKRTPTPRAGTFVLPNRNAHYIFRRTAATVAGMLGNVSERRLQSFLGHSNPAMTRKYVRTPPGDYQGERMIHGYRIKLTEQDDPIAVIDEFLDHCWPC